MHRAPFAGETILTQVPKTMPRYDYHCDSCGKDFEAVQRMSETPLTDCSCGSRGSVRRLVSAGNGVIFKGSGFYQTDYKGGGSSKKGSESASPSPESSTSTATESATATTATPAKSTGCGGGGCGCH